MIETRFAKLEHTPDGAVSHFEDGATWGALAHAEPHYFALAHRYGHEGNIVAYCRAHELCHHIVAEAFNSHSLVLWALAHGEQPTAMIAAAEEALAMALHRYAMTNELPFIDRVNWPMLKVRFEELTQ